MRKLAQSILAGHTADIPDEAQEWLFDRIWALAQKEQPGSEAEQIDAIWKRIENAILSRPAWIVPDWENAHFLGKEDFAMKIQRVLNRAEAPHPDPRSPAGAPGRRRLPAARGEGEVDSLSLSAGRGLG
jgi:hypothetical protein